MTSNDTSFKRECFSLLGLSSPENEKDVIENCIKDKIISVVAKHDGSSCGTKEAPALFVDNAPQEMHGVDEEYEGEGDAFEYMDAY